MKILVVNGPNLNFLGIRDEKQYGSQNFAYLENLLRKKAEDEGFEIMREQLLISCRKLIKKRLMVW